VLSQTNRPYRPDFRRIDGIRPDPGQGAFAITVIRSLPLGIAHLLAPARFLQQPAPAGGAEAPNIFIQFIVPMGLVFLIFYFLMFRPASKKQKAIEAMLKSLKNGDKVITSGGIYGTVAGITDDIIQLRVSNGVKIDVARSAVAGLQKEE
jgi:preprotein translocase subunit YajC